MEITPLIPDGFNGQIKRRACASCHRLSTLLSEAGERFQNKQNIFTPLSPSTVKCKACFEGM